MSKIDLTAGGRLTVNPAVTERKFMYLSEQIKNARTGGFGGRYGATALAETLSTSDAPFTFAHLTNFRNLESYDKAPNIWSNIATTEVAPDFNPITLYRFAVNFDDLKYGEDTDGVGGVAPAIPEGAVYPYAFKYLEEEVSLATAKRGFKTGWTLEKAVNDINRLISRFPQDMLDVGLATDEFVVLRALTQGVTVASRLAAGTDNITGDSIPVNAPASAAAIRVALRQIGARTDAEGNKVGLASRYYVVTALGEGDGLQWDLDVARNISGLTQTVTSGDLEVRPVPGGGGIGRIAGVLESEFVQSGYWYLVPAAGAGRRDSLVRVTLQGYTAPEVYVNNFTGIPVAGGASSSPFQAFHFDNDTVDLKFRQFTNGVLVSEDQIAWSTGTGTA